MLYHLIFPLAAHHPIFNVVKYISFRSLMAALTAMVISFLLSPALIRWLSRKQIGQVIRTDGPERHLQKKGTPTMGGIMILGSLIASSLLWARWDNLYVWLVLGILGGLGFYDDYRKLILKNSKGVSAKFKLAWQLGVALGVALILYYHGFNTQIVVPFFKYYMPEIGVGFVVLAIFVVVGASNAVNLTDGLDGLAIGPVMISALTFLVLTYLAGHRDLASYLNVMYVRDAGELAIICAGIFGAGIGFLWYNTYPAQVFMGDVGSLALGGALGGIALISKNEILFL